MLTVLDGLVEELRAYGIPVSVAEHVDAARSLEHVDLLAPAEVRSALRATLVKNRSHLGTFDLVFNLYFGHTLDLAQVVESGHRAGVRTLADLSEDMLQLTLTDALRVADNRLIRLLAAELVRRHVRIDPGRPVAGTFYLYRAMRAVDVDGIVAELSAADDLRGGPAAQLQRRLASERADDAVAVLRQEVEAEIRRRLVADRGADAVARTLRRPLPEDLDFLQASHRDAATLRAVLQPMARKLAARLQLKRRQRARGILDLRRTIRRSVSSGGIADPVFRPRRPTKPRLVIIADISGSVASFAGFTLQLVYALRTEFATVRSFVFVDGMDEVTDVFARAEDVAAAAREINASARGVRYGGRSDYGSALESFAAEVGPQLSTRSTVLILGDARTNNLPARAEALGVIAARSAHLYWLNPEPAAAWDSGDSVMSTYGRYCERVVECRNVRQLRAFIESLGS
ncbi:MAG TPA: VWA domain-containing protein [Kribbella sp.]